MLFTTFIAKYNYYCSVTMISLSNMLPLGMAVVPLVLSPLSEDIHHFQFILKFESRNTFILLPTAALVNNNCNHNN